MNPDIANAIFEAGGSAFVAISIARLLRERRVAGVSWLTIWFFAGWGLWNLFYYPHLGQWWSFAAGTALTATNAAYMILLIRFSIGDAAAMIGDNAATAVPEIAPQACPSCDFSRGTRGMDRCCACDGTGSIFRVGRRIFPNTEIGYKEAQAMLIWCGHLKPPR